MKRSRMSNKSPEKFTPEEWQARFDAAAKQAQREYCNIFEFWRACRLKPCRKTKTCGGDPHGCLKWGLKQVPEEIQDRAFDRVVWATPADADRPTKSARQFTPFSFYLWPLQEQK
jgi:hypothetical protein